MADDPVKDISASLIRERASDIWVRGLVESTVDGIMTIDERGIILEANLAAQRMFGYTREKLVGSNVSLIMPEQISRNHDNYIASYLETGVRRIIGVGREVTARHKNGAEIPLHLSVSEVCIGEHRYFSGMLRDISVECEARLEQERLLRELKERNKKITCLYSVGEVIREQAVETDIFRAVAQLIRPACSYPEITRARIVFDGQVYEEMAVKTTPWTFGAPIIVGGRNRGKLELVYREAVEPSIPGKLLRGDCAMIEAIARTLGEAVEHREAEAQVIQASKLASIGELAAGVGHEINNPINGVMNCADILLKNMPADSPDRQFAELIRSEAERVATIVKNLLTFSRQQQEQYSYASIRDVVDSVLSLSTKKIQKSSIKLSVVIAEELPRIRCRPEQLQQVLMNLLINAIHALDERYKTSASEKKMTIAVEAATVRRKKYLVMVVEDQGKGMSDATRIRMFDPFFTTKGRDKGTGLGLSVSDGIVKDHGGFFKVKSEPDSYTQFRVFLPVDGPDKPEPRE
ncbi:MAG: PAS domain S-box protein [Candidatus Hydrogenedentes bacterium]|nr:PAS domain S-box protein [Candidatus Hydrogenedentota bacterium]